MNFFSPFDSKKESKLFFLCKCLQIITQKISCSHLYIIRVTKLLFSLKFRSYAQFCCSCNSSLARNCAMFALASATNKNFAQKCRISKKIYVKVFFCRKPQSIYSLLCGLCPISQQIYILRIMQCFGVLDKFRLKMSGLYRIM